MAASRSAICAAMGARGATGSRSVAAPKRQRQAMCARGHLVAHAPLPETLRRGRGTCTSSLVGALVATESRTPLGVLSSWCGDSFDSLGPQNCRNSKAFGQMHL